MTTKYPTAKFEAGKYENTVEFSYKEKKTWLSPRGERQEEFRAYPLKRVNIFAEKENLFQIFNTVSKDDWADILDDISYLAFLSFEYLGKDAPVYFVRFVIEFVCFLKKYKQPFNRLLEVENIIEKEEE